MSIRLVCISYQDGPPAEIQDVIIGEQGGSVGRAVDNDFVVHDPNRYASRYHARIFKTPEGYVFQDRSATGTLVNNELELTSGENRLLVDGDTLLIGDCVIEVHVETADTRTVESELADIARSRTNAALAGIQQAESHHNAETIGRPDAIPPVNDQAPRPAQEDEATEAIAAFLGELNMDVTVLNGNDRIEALKLSGFMLRKLTQGVMEVLKARNSIKKSFRMDITRIKGSENNALKFSATAVEALQRMLTHEQGFSEPRTSVDEAVEDVKAHQVALMTGMNAAIEKILTMFDPDELEKEFKQGFSLAKKAKYWDLYLERYARMAKESERGLNELLINEFRQSYEAQIDKLHEESAH